ncbi:uncharacterized protein [Salminus brasiliensis]|uniref:uncharacterized protein n=1 Tax=Salminus brasiliensis TaxID=930266 RepID=UPI003B838D83
MGICDKFFNWNGWYRLFYYGMNIRMADSCVPAYSCGTYYTLWLNGSHPQIEDGVVTRQVCANAGYDCCFFGSTSIQVKACPGNYYVYKIIKPAYYCNMAYCTNVSTITPNLASTTGSELNTTSGPTNHSFDPCKNYSIAGNYWRKPSFNGYFYQGHDDTVVEWKGWYRLYIEGKSAQIADTNWCGSYTTCGGYTALWLNGSHPRLEDGIVTKEIYGSYSYYWYYGNQCTFSRSNSVQVKACPGDYYVYRLVRPDVSLPMPTYCAVVFNRLTYDPCHNYISLDQPWRANNATGLNVCDQDFNWNGWYRLFYYGMNIHMAESCVDVNRCGSYYTLWLNGPHPQVEDGVVTRQVCANAGYDCCYFRSTPIRVKACPGNYYVYELVNPEQYCNTAYCTAPSPTNNTDPCNNYNVLDDNWRNTHTFYTMASKRHDDTLVEWNGWYRLYLQGKSAQISEWCVSSTTCGGYTPLWLNGSHPQVEDGIVTRDIYGTNHCSYSYTSNPIKVKACPGQYYVYKLVRPKLSNPVPSYCAVAFDNVTDPCFNYVSLDQPWRANNESVTWQISDSDFYWNGWYRLYYYGMNIRMSESCVDVNRCGSYNTLWLNGSHPQIEDGVVTRQICGKNGNDCCYFRSNPIRIKACPGNYYVYELVSPLYHMTYCTDVSTITPTNASTTATTASGFNITTNYTFDPCHDYTAVDDDWRNISSWDYWYWYKNRGHDDTVVEWNGWYRFYFHGASAQIFEGCVSYTGCGGFTALWLGGSHPRLGDGIVTREIYGSRIDQDYQCYNNRLSKPIQVKACPGDYYVYKLVKPDSVKSRGEITESLSKNFTANSITVTFTKPSDDPCYNYDTLDDPQRSTNQTNYWWWWCDTAISWNGWYRLLYDGNNIRMPETCVTQGRCGTDIPLWLNGSHPRLEDGVVTRQVCGSWYGDCCYFKSFPIQVKACPGNYYVYEFVSPVTCASAYCAGVVYNNNILTDLTAQTINKSAPQTFFSSATVDPCKELNCTVDEWCGERDGVYGCFCNESRTRTDQESFDSREQCESSSGTMSLSRCQLFEAGFSADVLHLSDPNCTGTLQNGRLVFHFDNNDHICGTNLTANGTHFIYENAIQGVEDSAEGPINRKNSLKLNFSCVYQISQTLTMDIELNPLESIIHKTLPDGQGMYQVRMIPYQDAGLSHPYNGSVNLKVNQRIYVGVFVQGVDSRQIATVIDSCWATPEKDQHYAVRWDLIVKGCPNPADKTVKVLQNGVSTTGSFSLRMFAFNSDSRRVFLHCSIHLCLLQSNNCAANCSPGHQQRAGRSVLDIHDRAAISVGPFTWTAGSTALRLLVKTIVGHVDRTAYEVISEGIRSPGYVWIFGHSNGVSPDH